jgi:hypothetical protein
MEMAGAIRICAAFHQHFGKFMKMKGQVKDINSQ